MDVKIELIPIKKLAGKRIRTSLAKNETRKLWMSFMALRKNTRSLNKNLYSIEIYHSSDDFKNFNPDTEFEKWAAVEVKNFTNIPEGLETLVIPAGLYAVFIHRGPSAMFHKTAEFIFNEWLPTSDYVLDDRPHFEVMDENYRPDDPEATEQVWIPVELK